MISKHIFNSDVISGNNLWIDEIRSTGDTVYIDDNVNISNNVDISGNVFIKNNLTVKGSTTTLDTITVTVDDHNIELGSVDNPTNTTAEGGGITLKGSTDKKFIWGSTFNESWESSENLGVADGKYIFADKIRARDSAGLFLEDDGGNGIFVKDGGNVGVGTTTPGEKLRIEESNSGVHLIARFQDASNSDLVKGIRINKKNKANSQTTYFDLSVDAEENKIGIGLGNNSTELSNGKVDLSNSEIVIDSFGRVGIGATSPSHELTIGSSTDPGTTDKRLKIFRGADDAGQNLEMGYRSITVTRDSNTLAQPQSTFSIKQRGSNGERTEIFVDSIGNLGIGTTAPSGKLDVNGDIKFNGDILPYASETFDIGSASKKVRDIYLSASSLHIGNQDISVDAEETLLLPSGVRIGYAEGPKFSTDGTDLSLGSSLSLANTLSVAEGTTLSKTLSVGGAASVAGATTLSNSLSVAENATLSKALSVGGIITLSQNSAPNTTTNKLYNASGNLFWNGVDVINNYSSVSSLTDTKVTSPGKGHLLIYDASNSEWVNSTLTASSNITISNSNGGISIASAYPSTATSSTLGLVKIGYTENGKNYPVKLNSGKMYVNVPWIDTNTQRTDTEIRTAVGGSFPSFSTSNNGQVLKVINGVLSWAVDEEGSPTSAGGASTQIQYNSNGNFAGSANLTFDGTNLSCKGDVTAYASSDERLKNNISNISSSIEKIKQINGVNFQWSDKQSTYSGKDVGVIAQEVQKVLPEVVTEREDGYLAVKYEKIIPLLIEAIKDQQKEIEDLKKKLS